VNNVHDESIYLQKLYCLMSNPYCSRSHAIEFPKRAISLKLYNLTYYNTTPFESSLRKNCQFQLTKQQNESVRVAILHYNPQHARTHTHTHDTTRLHNTHACTCQNRNRCVVRDTCARLKGGRRPLSFISVCLAYSVLMSVRV